MSLSSMAAARRSAEPQIIEQIAAHLDNVSAPDWLVKWLIERDTLGQIYAGWNVGKSVLAVDIACRVAAGLPVAGRRTQTGSVLYVAAEGKNGIRRRFAAWQAYNECPVENCIYQTIPPVRLPGEEIERDLTMAREDIEAEHGPLVLVVLDTASATMTGDQKHGADMNDYLAALYRVFPGVTKMLLHHVGHADKTRARGASELPAACDWEFRLDEMDDFDKVIRLHNTKQRDAALHRDIYFRLVPVILGIDGEGDEYGSVVAEYFANYEPAAESERGPSRKERDALGLLNDLYERQRETVMQSGHKPDSVRVLAKDWQQVCRDAGIKTGTYGSIKSRLQKKGLIAIEGLHVLFRDT